MAQAELGVDGRGARPHTTYPNTALSQHKLYQYNLALRLLVLVEGIQETVNILLRQVVGRGQAQLVRFGSSDSNFLFLPQPVLEVHADDWGHIYRCYRAA